jgi:hypothetical protein
MRKILFPLFAFILAILPAWAITNPGVYTLASVQVTTALTSSAQTAITDLDGATAFTIEARFLYGSGGTTASATVQTTLDDTNWIDIARFDFTTSTSVKHANLSAALSKAVTSYSGLSSEGVIDGVLGSKLRAVITTTGTYANTTLSVRAAVR